MKELYPNTEVVGVTTTGEIGPTGFSTSSLSVMAFEETIAKAVLMKDIAKYPIFYRDDLLQALKHVNINPRSSRIEQEGFCLVFPNGLVSAEEKMLSVVNSIFESDGFPVFGGTAGDDAKFKVTYVSYNGEISSQGGIVVFVKNQDDIVIQKENIFVSIGKKMKATKVDLENRIVSEFNGRKASAEYARLLGISESQLSNHFMQHPLGRTLDKEIWIASPFQVFPDGSIEFYCQIYQDSVVELLEPQNPVEILKNSIYTFKSQFQHIEGVLAINCVLRKLQFENQHLISTLNQEISKLPNLCGFSSYGEQLWRTQLNQTMILLGIGQKKNDYGGVTH